MNITQVKTMTHLDVNLIQQVKICGDGASVHTRNKAICYYSWYKTSPKIRKELETKMRQALASGDWSALQQRMRKWF
jgi:hypothetical protein